MRSLFLLLVLICLASSAEEIYAGYTGYWENVVATAYSPHDPIDGTYHASKGDRWRWITADGKTDVREKPYGIAVPVSRTNAGNLKPLLPFGTKVIIPVGQGYLDNSKPNDRVFEVDDTGNGKEYFKHKNGMLHIDLRYMQHKWAIKWGEKQIKVFIVTGVAQVEVAKPSYEDDPFWDPNYKPKPLQLVNRK
ncbi:exported hypothetical protein [Azospirillaceae bacterium]